MALTDASVVNSFLEASTLSVQDNAIAQEQLDAEAIIRGKLLGIINLSTMQTWISPGTTPILIQRIAGRLIASQLLSAKNLELTGEVDAEAVRLWDIAMNFLQQIIDGTMSIAGLTDADTAAGIEDISFYPNDLAGANDVTKVSSRYGDPYSGQGPKFSMSDDF